MASVTLVTMPETAQLGLVSWERATIEGVDFRRAAFAELRPTGCVFVRCDFRGMVFDARLQPLFTNGARSIFRECRFDEADLRKSSPGPSRFEDCTFDGARLEGWTSYTAEFVDCHFAGLVQGAKFYGKPHGVTADQLVPPRAVNEFRGNDFRDAVLIDTLFVHGVQFAKQRWPGEPGHVRFERVHQRLQRARVEAMQWPDTADRTAALEMIMRLSTQYQQQTELVRVRHDGGRTDTEIQDRVWALVARPLA